MLYTRDELKALLKENVCEVVFTRKSDGVDRTIICTRSEKAFLDVMKEETKEDKPERVQNLETLPVFDLQSGHWKSFRLDSVKSCKIVEKHDYF